MAHAKSAIKRHRQSLRRRERNRSRRSEARSAVRRARELIAAGQSDEAEAAIREASSILDRVARKGTIHRNTAARGKSRLMRALNKGGDSPQGAKARKGRRPASAAAEDADED